MHRDLLLLLVGLGLLVIGGERAVESASAIATTLGFPPLFVGVTLVAVGSSVPEIATAVYAGLYGAGDFLVGHVIGSTTSQITLGVGLVALLSPLQLARADVQRYGAGMLAATLVMLAAVASGVVTRLEGVGMVALYVGFLAVRYRDEDEHERLRRRAETDLHPRRAAAWLVAGFALVAVGGHLLVTSGRAVAVGLGVPSYLVGLLTGLGTTAPEIAIAMVAVHRGEPDIAVGTLFGSNITDPLFSLGVGAAVDGLVLTRVGATMLSAGYLLVASLLVLGVFYVREEMGRVGAVGCILLYLPAFFV